MRSARECPSTIEVVAPPDSLATRSAQTPRKDLPALYAEAGLWYDALAVLDELIEQSPRDRALVPQRAALLRQVGLPEISAE